MRGRPRTTQDGRIVSIYLENKLIEKIIKEKGKTSLSRFISYTMDEVVNGKKPDLCSVELSQLKKENMELQDKICRMKGRTNLVKNFKDLEGSNKTRFIELLIEDTEDAQKFKPPKKGDTGFKRWQDRSRFMVDKYKNLCGLDLKPHEWINLIENNPTMKMGVEE